MDLKTNITRMDSFPAALELLLQSSPLLPTEFCHLEDAAGRVLRQTIVADRAFPAHDRVMMDGYALRFSDWQAGHRTFQITGSAPAGRAAALLPAEKGSCLEVMTGAPCPLDADCIIPVEDAASHSAGAVSFTEAASPMVGRFLHRAGSDAAAGQILLTAGHLLGSREIGVAASCGAVTLTVSSLPRIAVMATGDELIAAAQIPHPHQIRQSNAHSIAAALIRANFSPQQVGVLRDDPAAARPLVRELIENHDWLVLTGAVSKGAHDFVPALMADLGCRKLFHGVAQRPGKPAGCWVAPSGALILALPGNPVSALTGLHTLLLPALAVASGRIPSLARRVVMEDTSLQLPDFTRHLPVHLRSDGRAEPAATGNSGDFIGLLNSEGFITLPPRGSSAVAFPFTPWL